MKFKFYSLLLNEPDTPPPKQKKPKDSDGFDLLLYYKELYEKEVELSDRLNTKTSNAITLLTILGSGYVLLIAEIFPIVTPMNVFSVIVLSLCAANLVAFVVTLWKFWRAYTGFKYNYFPIDGMESTMTKAIERGMDKESRSVIRKRLIALYREGAINNRKLNLGKSERQRSLSKTIAISMLLVVATFLLWFVFLKYAVPVPPPTP